MTSWKERIVFTILLVITLGCKKSSQHDENISGIKGDLILSRSWFTTFTDTSKVEEKYEYAKASFIKENYYRNAGVIKYGDSTLHLDTFAILYFSYQPDSSVPDFIHAIDGDQLWTISGSATNNIPSFSVLAPSFPSFLLKNFDTIPIIHKSQSFTLSWDAIIPCDSISIGIYQSNNVVQSGTLPGNISSITFSKSQLSIFEFFFPAYIIIEGRSYKNINVSGIPITVETYSRRNCNTKIID